MQLEVPAMIALSFLAMVNMPFSYVYCISCGKLVHPVKAVGLIWRMGACLDVFINNGRGCIDAQVGRGLAPFL